MAKYWLYVGTYTRPAPYLAATNGDGIYIFQFDSDTGQLERTGEVNGIDNPSYMAIDGEDRYLYADSEVWLWPEGTLSAYAINKTTGELTYLNKQATLGSINAYVSVDKSNQYVMVANFWDGQSITMFPVEADGRLSPYSSTHEHTEKPAGTVPARQDKSHAHCIIPDPTNTYAMVCDLGLDKIMVYRMDLENGQLVPHDPAFTVLEPGSGPRHMIFHPNGRYAYVIQELSSTVCALAYDSDTGTLTPLQTISTLPDGFDGTSHCSDIHVTPSGKFLYAGNRGHDSLAIYAIDENTGQLTALGHQLSQGTTPRNFMVDPTGKFVLVGNQDSDAIVVFEINEATGLLDDTGITVDCPTPVCLKMIAAE